MVNRLGTENVCKSTWQRLVSIPFQFADWMDKDRRDALHKILNKPRIFTFALLSGCAWVMVGCASNTNMTEEGTASYSPPTAIAGEYRIGADDRVQVSVWRNPDLSMTVPVRPDGMISVPLIGDVLASGKTAPELAATIKEKLSTYVRDPFVTVIVTELRSHEFLSRVRVTGAVRAARSMPYRPGMTVLDVILEAGGVNDFAAPNRTKLYRTTDGKTRIFAIDLGDILYQGKLQTNMKLVPGDVITVPERFF